MMPIRMRTMRKVNAIEPKLCRAVHDFLYLINFVFLSSQLSAIAEGTLNNMLLSIIPVKLELLVT